MSFEQDPNEQADISGADLAILIHELKVARLQRDKMWETLLLVLDQVDYTRGACSLTEMVGACLPSSVITLARAAIADVEEAYKPQASSQL